MDWQKKVKKIGRTMWYNDTLWMAYSGSGAEFFMEGNGAKIIMQGDSTAASREKENQARIAIYVNEECVADDMMDAPEKTYTVQKGKEPGPCRIRIIKLTESAMSTVGIKKIETDSETKMYAPEDQARFIEFVGDSITCGYGVEDEDPEHGFVTATENVTKAYAYKTAKALNADYSMVSLSGYGIISGYSEDGETKLTNQLMPNYYKKLGFSYGEYLGKHPEEEDWNFSKRQPDMVVVNLGTNDDSYTLDYAKRQEEFAEAYAAFLEEIRRCNPKAEILCVLGIMGDRLYPFVEKAVCSYREKTGDGRIHVMPLTPQLPEDGLVADYHPTERTHEKAAGKMVEKIKEIMRW